jgi:hypothetical protein
MAKKRHWIYNQPSNVTRLQCTTHAEFSESHGEVSGTAMEWHGVPKINCKYEIRSWDNERGTSWRLFPCLPERASTRYNMAFIEMRLSKRCKLRLEILGKMHFSKYFFHGIKVRLLSTFVSFSDYNMEKIGLLFPHWMKLDVVLSLSMPCRNLLTNLRNFYFRLIRIW